MRRWPNELPCQGASHLLHLVRGEKCQQRTHESTSSWKNRCMKDSEGGPSVTRWVFLRTAEVISLGWLALVGAVVWRYAKFGTTDGALLTAIRKEYRRKCPVLKPPPLRPRSECGLLEQRSGALGFDCAAARHGPPGRTDAQGPLAFVSASRPIRSVRNI